MWAAAIGPPPTTQKLTLSFTPFSCLSSVGTPPPSVSAEITPVFAGILGHRCLPKAEEIYSNVIAEMLSRPTCAKLVLLCKFACKSAADNLHSKTKAEPLAEFSASVSTYLQGNSRVDKPFRMEDKTRAIISGAGERGNPRDTSPPPWRGRFCSFGFPDSRSAPHYLK